MTNMRYEHDVHSREQADKLWSTMPTAGKTKIFKSFSLDLWIKRLDF